MTSERKATKHQIARIVDLFARNKLLFEPTQTLIDAHKDKPLPKQRRKQEPATDPNLVFWDERYPGKGEAIMEILRPFYGWKPERKPALPDLEERAKAAIFWRDIKDVHAFSNPISLWASLWTSLGDSLRTSLGDSLRDSLWDSLWASLRAALFCPLGFIIMDKLEEAAKFKPLHDFWLVGNFPVGFDEEGNLLVLVAPTT